MLELGMAYMHRHVYGHIFCYFVERPGVFTKQELMQSKSLEAYNYFQSGHVRNIRLFRLPATQSCVMMTFVNPSQNAPIKSTMPGLE